MLIPAEKCFHLKREEGLRKMRRRRTDTGFAITAAVLVILVVLLALTLKFKDRSVESKDPIEQEMQVPQVSESESDKQGQTTDSAQEGVTAESQIAEETGTAEEMSASERIQEAVNEEQIAKQRETFVTDYTSAPLLNTTSIKYLTMEMGAQPGEVRFNWFAPSGSKGQVILYNTSSGETQTFSAQTAVSATEAGFYYHKATASGLQENTTYTYKVGNNDGWSPEYTFTTKNFTGDFSFMVTSDAQIGQSQTEDVQVTIDTWDKVVNRLTSYVPDSAFLIHLGDQVAAYNEPSHYSGFFEHLALYQTPLVPVVGNHDVDNWDSGGGPWFYERYNVPNRSTIGCNWADTDGDYWFRYGNALFLVLNSSSIYLIEEHETFVEQAIAANPDAKWRIVLTHHSAYSSVAKYQEMCAGFQNSFSYMMQHYDIDLYLSGHDHAYTRTAIINELNETLGDYDYESGSAAVNPAGALYVTTGTASGCIYQEITDNYAAVKQGQPGVPTAMRVDVTDHTLKLTTYLMDSWQIYDEYTLEKD